MYDELPPEVLARVEAAEQSPPGPTAMRNWEGAIQAADAAGCSVSARMHLRLELVSAAAFGSKQYDRALGPFAVVLGEADRNPEADWINWHSLLWKYKWLASNLASYAMFPRERVLSVLDDFAARCAAHGYSERPAENYRAEAYWMLGDEDAAGEAFARFENARRDPLCDCHACEAANAISHAERQGDDEGAVQRAEPLLARRLTCAEEPERTHAKLLCPLLRLGRPEDADKQHRLGLRALEQFPQFTWCAAKHFVFLTRTGRADEAPELIRKTVAAAATASDENRRDYLTAMGTALEALANRTERRRRFRLPEEFPVPDAGAAVRPSELAEQVNAAADEIVARFDARNGNDAVSRRQAADRAYARGE